MTNKVLEKEFKYFLDNQDELVKKYNGLFILIKDQEVKGSFQSATETYLEATKKYEEGTFLIQECLPGEDVYTQTFHSRVVF